MDVVRSDEEIPVAADKENKRDQALRAWWTILSHSLVSSAVGRKVTVEARVDNLREVALEILDATFAVKSPGTLLRRLFAIQAYEAGCVERLGKHWLPVVEFEVWTYVRWLQSTKALATKASSVVEALRFAWFCLVLMEQTLLKEA